MSAIAAHRTQLEAIAGGKTDTPGVTHDEKGRLVLPATPALDDPAGLCTWLTAVFALDPKHPITGGERQGHAGPDGHVELRRAGAPSLRFEPAAQINSPNRLHDALAWWMLPSDGAVRPFKAEHCRQIAHVVRMLCGLAGMLSATQEAAGIVATYLGAAHRLEGHTTYGTTGQRYEAAVALQRTLDETSGRPMGPPRYLIDANTGEIAIRVADLAGAARMHVGSSLPRGFLDARMQALGWTRMRLDGHAISGRGGRVGPHARADVYRGHLPHDGDEDVTT
jgi:hypothetical protein